ncbi:amidase [Streptomyces scopuliridis]|uniref:Amidase n=1 Tax=Streptomyces scopuliridis TaxID=452529 RepID=A0ACD4ZQJ5_9ACTN|nr:amidase [Streptomyces scopuliridis]WSB36475.1 amidase [Streptomyces scopuliridis]WSC00773.1 amidase [Streptomyces scopuliridis]WSC05616.1 amidase [Streptomyces scopuliridis]
MSRAVNRRIFLAGSAAVTGAVVSGTALAPPAAAVSPVSSRSSRSPKPYVPDLDAAGIEVRDAARRDPTEATLAEAAVLMSRRKLTSTALVEAYLDRIGTYDSTYQAYAEVTGETALAAARAADRSGGRRGVLSGIPLCVKDNYFTRGVPTRCNSLIFADFVPNHDATAVARLTAAGGIVLGKGQMGPLATTRATTPNGTVTTVNAWTPDNPATDPGGSSTGPACAVAGRMASSSIGTQTGGSIVLPSNRQNLTGLKPTMGRVSAYGVIPLSYTRDHPGPLARDAMDAALMLAVMAGPDAHDPRTLGLPGLPDLVRAATPVAGRGGAVRMRRATRIGVPADFLNSATEVRKAFLDRIDAISGVTLVDITYPADWPLLTGMFNDARLSERTEPFRHWLREDPALFGVSLLSWLQGLMLSGDEWITAQRAKNHLLREVLDGVLSRCDVLLQTGPVPFDILGLPEIAFPIGFTAGLPSGVILGGAPYEEDRLLEVAAAYQAVTDWHTRRPADPAAPAASGPGAKRAAGAGRPRLTAEEAAAQSA